MEILRSLYNKTPEFKVSENKEMIKRNIVGILEKFSKELLHEIFSKNLNRDDFPLLHSNAVMVSSNMNDAGDTAWSFIFFDNYFEPGIHLLEDQQWTPKYSLPMLMAEYELTKGTVRYGFYFTQDEFFPVRPEVLKQKVKSYIDSVLAFPEGENP
jgi:hypothetical protein